MKKAHSKIAIVIGTKAELIKCMPVMKELQNQKYDYWFISTGQHPLKKSCQEFRVKEPDFILSKEPELSTKFWSKINKMSMFWAIAMIFKVKKKVHKIKPKYVIYHGDTMSTAAASIGSSNILNWKKPWKSVHLEAGLRSGSLWEPFPEEISRRISSRFSDILLAVSELTENNLKKSKGKVIRIGNTVIDSSTIVYNESVKKNKFDLLNEDYVLINIHRHEHLRSKENMEKIVNILEYVGIKGIWSLHDNTKHYLEKYNLMTRVEQIKNIKITPLVDYFKFIFLLANCKYIITDGGSIQEESLVFKKPCIILRNRTERQEGLTTGINFLTKLDIEKSKEIIRKIEDDQIEIKNFKNPYGEPGVSKKIVGVLLK